MTSLLQLTEQTSPSGQTFIVEEDSVLTGIGVFFASADDTYPITLELRPTTESGSPSSTRFIPGSKVVATGSAVSAVANGTFSSAVEYKFTFPEPQFVPGNSLVSFVIYTSAPVGSYKMFVAKNGDFDIGSTTTRYTAPTNTADGSFFASSNGTTWTGDNNKDMAFKVYRAKFSTSLRHSAKFVVNTPPIKKLTETDIRNGYNLYTYDPLVFTAGADSIGVIHPAHGFLPGDRVTLSSINGLDSGDAINGVTGADILGTRTILSTDPFGYRVAIDATADSSIRAGGSNLYATEQYVINEAVLDIPTSVPNNTFVKFKADVTSTQSFGGNETAYASTADAKILNGQPLTYFDPYVVMTKDNEGIHLSGNSSTIIKARMITANEYVAPYVNAYESKLVTKSNLIDYQQSDDSSATNRNFITTIDYVSESEPYGGTTASKHITVPYYLENTSTSLVVLVDAYRPIGSDFTIWYRTANRFNEKQDIQDNNWYAFSKVDKKTSISGNLYSEAAASDEMIQEYEFAQFNLDAFDTYQIKITMNSTRSSYVPTFSNLRIIATSD